MCFVCIVWHSHEHVNYLHLCSMGVGSGTAREAKKCNVECKCWPCAEMSTISFCSWMFMSGRLFLHRECLPRLAKPVSLFSCIENPCLVVCLCIIALPPSLSVTHNPAPSSDIYNKHASFQDLKSSLLL